MYMEVHTNFMFPTTSRRTTREHQIFKYFILFWISQCENISGTGNKLKPKVEPFWVYALLLFDNSFSRVEIICSVSGVGRGFINGTS